MKKLQCLKMCKKIKLLPPEILKVAFDKLDSLLYYLNSEFCTDDADWPKCCYSKLFLGDRLLSGLCCVPCMGETPEGDGRTNFSPSLGYPFPKFSRCSYLLKSFYQVLYLCFTCLNPLISNKLSPLFAS